MNLTFIRATKDDVDVFLNLEKKVSGVKTYSPMLERGEVKKEIENNTVYLIKKGSEIIGSIMYENKGADHIYISGLVIDPRFQGLGIGREAMSLIMKKIGDAKRIDLVTHPDNKRAISLYESLGFQVESRKENYFGDGEPRVVMVKQ